MTLRLNEKETATILELVDAAARSNMSCKHGLQVGSGGQITISHNGDQYITFRYWTYADLMEDRTPTIRYSANVVEMRKYVQALQVVIYDSIW